MTNYRENWKSKKIKVSGKSGIFSGKILSGLSIKSTAKRRHKQRKRKGG